MSVNLDRWLIEHRDMLLPRWVSSFHGDSPVNGDEPTDYAANTTTEQSFPLLADEEDISDLFARIYEGLVLAARGDMATLDDHLHTIIYANGHQQARLPDLLAMSFHFRRLAWDIFKDDWNNPDQTFYLMQELENLIDYTIDSLSRSWEHTFEAEIQERISQAEFIAQSMADAIEEADRTALQFSSLNDSSQRLAASLENHQQLIEQIGMTLSELIGAAHIALWLPDDTLSSEMRQEEESRADLYPIWASEEQANSIGNIYFDQTPETDIVVSAYKQKTIIYRLIVESDTQGSWYREGHSVLVLPLMVKEQPAGVVLMQDTNPEERFSRSQQNLALALVNQAAIAIENARLYAQIRQFNAELEKVVEERTKELQAEKDRIATIHDISTEISSTLDLDTLLQTSLKLLARITKVEYGSIMLVEQETGHLVNRAVLGQKNINSFMRFPIGTGVAGWVAQCKEPALIQDIHQDERWVPLPTDDIASKHEGSMIAVPLIGHNEMLGVLILSHFQPHYFNEGHLRLLTASAGAIAIGINNAKMYETIFVGMERSSELLHRQQIETTKMEAILQSLSDGVLVCDTDSKILSANPAVGRILERDIESLFMGITLHDVLHDLLGDRMQEMPLNELLHHPLNKEEEARVFEAVVDVNMRVVSLTMAPVLKDRNELFGALLLMHDITREVEAERLKTEFIGTMSHELRTPMTSIKGYTQLLAMGGLGPVNDTQREFLNTIQKNSERMISMINDVLDITKIETGNVDLELRPIHLAESLSGVVTELQALITARSHTLTMSIPAGLPFVRADTNRLHQILNNMLSNAIKYTPNNGKVHIEACEVTHEDLPERIRSSVLKDRRYVQLDIIDNGVGIAEHEIDLIFDRFYRTENKLKIEAGGTGLGLSLVKPLIELLGGRIWVESVLDEGTTFSFILPAI